MQNTESITNKVNSSDTLKDSEEQVAITEQTALASKLTLFGSLYCPPGKVASFLKSDDLLNLRSCAKDGIKLASLIDYLNSKETITIKDFVLILRTIRSDEIEKVEKKDISHIKKTRAFKSIKFHKDDEDADINTIINIIFGDGKLIKQLIYNSTDYTINKTIIALAKMSPHLTHVNLRGDTILGCNNIINDSVIALAYNCPALTSINLGGYKKITNDSVTALARNCPALTHIDLSSCELITDDSITILSRNCPDLTHVDLSHCSKITDDSVTAIARNCRALTHVILSCCKRITNASVTALARNCPALAHVDLGSCCLITDVSVTALATHCLNLKYVRLDYCEGITNDSVYDLRKIAGEVSKNYTDDCLIM